MKKIELFLWLAFVVSAIAAAANLPDGFIVIISGFVLAIFYGAATPSLLLPQESGNNLPVFPAVTGKRAGAFLVGFVYGQSVVAILFKFCHWPGALIFLGLSIISLSSVLAFSIYKQRKKPSRFYQIIVVRTLIIASVVTVLFIIAASAAKFQVATK